MMKKNKMVRRAAVLFVCLAAMFFITGCEEIITILDPNVIKDNGGLSEEDKSDLRKVSLSKDITAAKEAKIDIEISTDGKDQLPGTKWVTSAVFGAFNSVIADAELAVSQVLLTEAEAAAVITALKTAVKTFTDSIRITDFNKDDLTDAIAAAGTARSGVSGSTDGKDKVQESKWVPIEVWDPFDAAITAAQLILANPNPAEGEVNDAVISLRALTDAFLAAIQITPAISKGALTSAITLAAASKVGVETSSGTNPWVTPTEMNAFDAAISSAAAVKDGNGAEQTQNEVDNALTALNAARKVFISNIKNRTFIVAPGTGTLISKGRISVTPQSPGSTYYLDAENGDDTNDGLSPLTPWKSLKKANEKTYGPGDHILLEADSIWNGNPTDANNYATNLTNVNVGLLYPKGDGSAAAPAKIDFYDIDNFDVAIPTVYTSANKRPIINGNGTPSLGSNRHHYSGAITLKDQEYWEIRNIEVTNTFANFLTNPDHYKDWENVPKMLDGILVMGTANRPTSNPYNHIVIESCYVHDVQTVHTNNSSKTITSWGGSTAAWKVVGGIIVAGVPRTPDGSAISTYCGWDDVLIQGNIVKRVGVEGLRTKAEPDGSGGGTAHPFKNVVIRGNYLTEIAGDAIVISNVNNGGLVESNLVKNACSGGLVSNWAGIWTWDVKTDTLLQYNECYGTLYGYQDGEAWDIDSASDKVTYQYNYSHWNAGGTILFMSSETNGVFRYNISANDGLGSRKLTPLTVGHTDSDGQAYSARVGSDSTNNGNSFANGQTLFHYGSGTTSGTTQPLIHNNTFYVGDGITVGIFGSNVSSVSANKVRFYNNIVVKEGTGTVYLGYGHSGSGTAGYLSTTSSIKNNIWWAYDVGSPNTGVQSKFNQTSSGTAIATLFTTEGNQWINPRLHITENPADVTALGAQLHTAFPRADYNNPSKLADFTSKERVRSRAAMFAPVAGSPAFGAGMVIPASGSGDIDGAWHGGVPAEDFFGRAVTNTAGNVPVGAAVSPYTPTYSGPY
jgi:hypothetical protein